jgi:hypothetical protein
VEAEAATVETGPTVSLIAAAAAAGPVAAVLDPAVLAVQVSS